MKKLILLSILLGSLIITGCTNNSTNQNQSNTNTTQTQITTSNTQNENTEQQNKKMKYFTLEEVTKHNQPGKDCRTIISGKVYDITNFFGVHPGGDEKIAQLCGKDGTEKFVKKHGNNQKALNKLKTFYIGELK